MARRPGVYGVDSTLDNLQDLVNAVHAEEQVEAVKQGASVLQASAAARVPAGAGAPSRGGRHLKDAIDMEVRTRKRGEVKVAVGPGKKQYHGIFIELGTMDMPADPYLRPAADSEGRDAVKVVRKLLRDEVIETTVKLYRRSRLLKDRRRVEEIKPGKKIRPGQLTIGGGRLLPTDDPRAF